jgi:hypothetical protein
LSPSSSFSSITTDKMLILYFLLIISISANDNNISIINVHEELPPNTLILSSISSSNVLQWLPSSYLFQSYFYLNQNQSLYTAKHVIDREEFCEKKYCNCSQCLINLSFLQTFSMNNVSIRTIQIIIKGKDAKKSNFLFLMLAF